MHKEMLDRRLKAIVDKRARYLFFEHNSVRALVILHEVDQTEACKDQARRLLLDPVDFTPGRFNVEITREEQIFGLLQIGDIKEITLDHLEIYRYHCLTGTRGTPIC